MDRSTLEQFRRRWIVLLGRFSRFALLAPIGAMLVATSIPERSRAEDKAKASAVEPLLAILKRMDAGDGSQKDAAAAWRQLAHAEPSQLPMIVAALDDAGPLATNWIRTAAEAIVEHSGSPSALPRTDLLQFLLDRRNASSARRFAYEILLAGDPSLADHVLPGMLDDPSLELRRDAVARVLDAADRLTEGKSAITQYEAALDAARDVDQIRHAVDKLGHLGRTVDLASHFGFVTVWKVIGPFDNRARAGYATAYPPEKSLTEHASAEHGSNFSTEFPGKEGPVDWHDFSTKDEYGQVDLNKALGRHLEAVAYAAADFNAASAAEVELRVGTENACRVWLNGRMLLESSTYHSLPVMDQFVGHGKLHAGHNTILVKLCQNEQTDEWARGWQFQLRVCDSSGKAIQHSTPQPSHPSTTSQSGGTTP